jgi:hypothetical protein
MPLGTTQLVQGLNHDKEVESSGIDHIIIEEDEDMAIDRRRK